MIISMSEGAFISVRFLRVLVNFYNDFIARPNMRGYTFQPMWPFTSTIIIIIITWNVGEERIDAHELRAGFVYNVCYLSGITNWFYLDDD